MVHDNKLEKSLISTILSDNNALIEHVSQVTIELFHNLQNKKIVKLILELNDCGLKPDHELIEQELESKYQEENIDIWDYLDPLNPMNLGGYILKLKELQYKRELGIICSQLQASSKSKMSDVFELNTKLTDATTKLSDILSATQTKSNDIVVGNVIKEIEYAKKHDGITGLITGFKDIDTLTGGFQNGHFVVMAGRPGMGKTALALSMAMNGAIDYEQNIVFFSMEMSAEQLTKRLVSYVSNIPLTSLQNKDVIDFKHIHESVKPIIDKGFTIYDRVNTLYDLKAQCRRENAIKKLDGIYIDYLQLIRHNAGRGRSKENEVSEVSRELKLLAMELNVPIICLSQLSRAVEQRGGSKIPQLSDLRDSGSIEQDADIVEFIYRPEYYDIYEDEDGNNTHGLAQVVHAKNRHGATLTIDLEFKAENVKFIDPKKQTTQPAEPVTDWHEARNDEF